MNSVLFSLFCSRLPEVLLNIIAAIIINMLNIITVMFAITMHIMHVFGAGHLRRPPLL